MPRASTPPHPSSYNSSMPVKDQKFQLVSEFAPAGDQPKAIEALIKGIRDDKRTQVLLGVTGSGKAFTMAPDSISALGGEWRLNSYSNGVAGIEFTVGFS